MLAHQLPARRDDLPLGFLTSFGSPVAVRYYLTQFGVCTRRPRFVKGSIDSSPRTVAQLETEGQTRLWWAHTPVDVFLDTTPFHADVGERLRREPFAGHDIPFLDCRDLAVFKAFSDRTMDWADLEEMQSAGTLDVEAVAGVLVRYLAPTTPGSRLLTLA